MSAKGSDWIIWMTHPAWGLVSRLASPCSRVVSPPGAGPSSQAPGLGGWWAGLSPTGCSPASSQSVASGQGSPRWGGR